MANRSTDSRKAGKNPLAIPFAPLILLAGPLVEIAAFIAVGSQIGILATIGLTVATSIIGAVLLRIQGFGVTTRIRAAMQSGDRPGRELVHGAMIVAAGLLLILPGFVTDTIGLLLFIPQLREVAWRLIRDRLIIVGAAPGGSFRDREGRIIDLDAEDYVRQDEEDGPPPPPIAHRR